MGRQFRPQRVLEIATRRMAPRLPNTKSNVAPAWFKAVEMIPPSEILTRPAPERLRPIDPRMHKPRRTFIPQQIMYEEDELRQTFFKDHPWELARPRIVLEIDGKDGRHCDWSKGVLQTGLPLSGECVVQRQMWLMYNKHEVIETHQFEENGEVREEHVVAKAGPLSREEAYDMARKEFYALRHQEQVEVRIAQEEARMVGAYFGKTRLQVSMGLEDLEYERWKKFAEEEMARIQAQRQGAYTSYGVQEESADPLELAAQEQEPQA